jgi:hypothetical protein
MGVIAMAWHCPEARQPSMGAAPQLTEPGRLHFIRCLDVATACLPARQQHLPAGRRVPASMIVGRMKGPSKMQRGAEPVSRACTAWCNENTCMHGAATLQAHAHASGLTVVDLHACMCMYCGMCMRTCINAPSAPGSRAWRLDAWPRRPGLLSPSRPRRADLLARKGPQQRVAGARAYSTYSTQCVAPRPASPAVAPQAGSQAGSAGAVSRPTKLGTKATDADADRCRPWLLVRLHAARPLLGRPGKLSSTACAPVELAARLPRLLSTAGRGDSGRAAGCLEPLQ